MSKITFGKLRGGEKFKLTNDPHSPICMKLKLSAADYISFASIIKKWKQQEKFDKTLYPIAINSSPLTAVTPDGELLRIGNKVEVFKVE
ncbi:MAG: hypothetical protein UR60_C0031G0003 [Candidatus Moranbacteria bacterium GW2011_GWF2_34_56]|nr:MAG: hypothetical protein UR51_C0019G0006 [Candidatus Moranbacteria bacterium GW2011_GWF1_34_10]KKP64016.1 MAG: hypothetical protein UR60_C0031G0003 [Candidatus Moranbacteria bacterium GW2011_GWF2_34_56]HBI16875.1 hypothetical protein [Candidatus Moranbacteria bacterium]